MILENIMRISAITPQLPSHTFCRVKNEPTTKTVSNVPSFKNKYNYLRQFEYSQKADLKKSFDRVSQIFFLLVEAAKDIPHPIIAKNLDSIDEKNIRHTLNNMKTLYPNSSDNILLKSNDYPSQIIMGGNGTLTFQHPSYRFYNNGGISFYLDSKDRVCVSRLRDYHDFHSNNKIRTYQRKNQIDGTVIESEYYNSDGSSNLWRHFFQALFKSK